MSNLSPWFITFAAILLLHPFLSAITLRAARGTREQFALLAKKMLSSPEYTENQKIFISEMIDDVFDWRFMAYACYSLPKAAFSTKTDPLTDEERAFYAKSEVKDLFTLHFRCVMAVSPAFTALFIIVAVITLVCIILFLSLALVSNIWADTVKHVSPTVGAKTNIARNDC